MEKSEVDLPEVYFQNTLNVVQKLRGLFEFRRVCYFPPQPNSNSRRDFRLSFVYRFVEIDLWQVYPPGGIFHGDR